MRTIYRDIVGAFVFSSDGKILLGKSNRGTYEGDWIVPGGGIYRGETKINALKRELLEETAIDANDQLINIERIDLDHGGESEKILKETGERVRGIYKFYVYTVRIDLPAKKIETQAGDDFQDITWHDLKNINLSPPTAKTLKHIKVL